VDLKPRPRPHLVVLAEPDSANSQTIGYDITAQITITDDTPFTFVVDPTSGDNLRIRAAGTLTTTIDPSGNIGLTGRLDVRRGKYRLSLYGLVTREFIIARGSSILWSGDPYNADLNITAIYKVKAVAADLLAAQGSNGGTDPAARNAIPFNVLLKVTDQLSKPTIGFDITQPTNTGSTSGSVGSEVDAVLANLRQPNQTSELSKQVFSLLVLGRFIQQNPFNSAAGEGIVASQLRGSVSQVLTDQLQNLTGKYLAGMGLDLGVTNQADYTTGSGSRTDLNVAVRRQLLNNRLTIRLGTDVPLSGGNQSSQSGNVSNFAGDLSLEYTLLADGRLRLRAFRQNAYEDIDGQIVRTGAALVFQRDYDNFKDLFAKVSRAEKRQNRDIRKQDKVDKDEQKRREQQQADSATATHTTTMRRDTTRRPVVTN
jgi:translocation and assembly module TamB